MTLSNRIIIASILLYFIPCNAIVPEKKPLAHVIRERFKKLFNKKKSTKNNHADTTNEKTENKDVHRTIIHSFIKKFRSQKNKPDYPAQCIGKTITALNESELLDVIDYAKKSRSKDLVLKAYYHLIALSTDHEKIKVYKLDLADYCYELGKFENAGTAYEEFYILYPGSVEAEYSQYKTLLCMFFLSLDADRDQTLTDKTISIAQDFLKKAKQQKYLDEAESILKECRSKLLDHEVFVIEQLLRQKHWTAVEKRIEYIKTNFQDISHIEQYVIYLEKMLKQIKDPNHFQWRIRLNLDDAIKVTIKKDEPTKEMSRKTKLMV